MSVSFKAAPPLLLHDNSSIDAFDVEISTCGDTYIPLNDEYRDRAVAYANKHNWSIGERKNNVVFTIPIDTLPQIFHGKIELWVGHTTERKALAPKVRLITNLNRCLLELFNRNGITDRKLHQELAAILPRHAGWKLNHPLGLLFVDRDFHPEVLNFQKVMICKISKHLSNTLKDFLSEVYPDVTFVFNPVINRLENSQDMVLYGADFLQSNMFTWIASKLERKFVGWSPRKQRSSRIHQSAFGLRPSLKRRKGKRSKENILLITRVPFNSWDAYKTFCENETTVTLYFDGSHESKTEVMIQLVGYPFFVCDSDGVSTALARLEPSFRKPMIGKPGQTLEKLAFILLEKLTRYHLDSVDIKSFNVIPPPTARISLWCTCEAVGLSAMQTIRLSKALKVKTSWDKIELLKKYNMVHVATDGSNIWIQLRQEFLFETKKDVLFGLNPANQMNNKYIQSDGGFQRKRGRQLIAATLATDSKLSVAKIMERHSELLKHWSFKTWQREARKIKDLLSRDQQFHAHVKRAALDGTLDQIDFEFNSGLTGQTKG